MPKAPKKSAQADDDESDEEVASTPAPSQAASQADRAPNSMSQSDKDRKVNDLVIYLLLMDKKKIPIKRQDINKNVLKEHARSFLYFIRRAEAQLQHVFGMSLEEVEGRKSYILINNLDNDADDPHQIWPEEDNTKIGLLMFILSTIFMSGNTLPDTVLYHTLKKLGIDMESQKPHATFGDARKLITQEFPRQGYLEYIKIPNTDPARYEFKWGPRAKCETSKQNCIDFVCQIYEEDNPQVWRSQWQDIQRNELHTDVENGIENES